MVSGQVWPDGTFGISLLGQRTTTVSLEEKQELSIDEETFRRSCDLHGLIPSLEVWGKVENGMDVLNAIATENAEGELGSSLAANSHKPVRGQAGISSNGRLMVRNGALLLEQKYGKAQLSFLTLTLPTTSTADNQLITEKWPDIVRVYIQWLGRRLRSHGLDGEIVGCVEIQEERSEWQEGILGLHLHLVFRGRRPHKAWVLTPDDFREEWTKVLKNILGPSGEGYYYGATENVKRVRKSASRYLGKYLSKGSKAVLHFKTLYPDHRLPSCWSVCTLRLRKAIKDCKMAGAATAGQLCSLIQEGRFELFTKLVTATYIDSNGKEQLCGWYGTLSEEGQRYLGLDTYVKMRLSLLAAAGEES